MSEAAAGARTAHVERKTAETEISVDINLDGIGKNSINTGIGFLDHMLCAMSKHGRIDLTLRCLSSTTLRGIFFYGLQCILWLLYVRILHRKSTVLMEHPTTQQLQNSKNLTNPKTQKNRIFKYSRNLTNGPQGINHYTNGPQGITRTIPPNHSCFQCRFLRVSSIIHVSIQVDSITSREMDVDVVDAPHAEMFFTISWDGYHGCATLLPLLYRKEGKQIISNHPYPTYAKRRYVYKFFRNLTYATRRWC